MKLLIPQRLEYPPPDEPDPFLEELIRAMCEPIDPDAPRSSCF